MNASAIPVAWWAWTTAMLWQSTLLIVAVALLDRVLRGRAWPELLHGLWLLVGLKLLLPPHLAAPWREPRLLGRAAPSTTGGASLLWVAFAVWAAGALVVMVAGHRRQLRFRDRALASSRPAGPRSLEAARRAGERLGLRRSVEVRELEASAPSGALVIGCRAPLIVVPATWVAQLDDDALEHVLAHELAHVRRRDLWVEHAIACLHALYWFHPLLPLLRSRARAARELCCDATVARSLCDPRGYHATLLELGSQMAPPSRRGSLAAAAAIVAARLLGRRSLLLIRLDALERARRSERAGLGVRRAASAIVLAGAAACGLPLAAPASRDLAAGQAEFGQTAALAELERARADFAALARRDDVGSLHLRWAVARVASLERQAEP